MLASWCLLANREWWDHVTVTPDDNSTTVFSNGTPHGERGLIPIGGHELPSSIEGANLLWKNLQKNAKKKQISDTINRIIPIRNPRAVGILWNPCIVPSRTTSRHHWIMVIIIIRRPKDMSVTLFVWNHETNPVVRNMALSEPITGQGLTSTKW